MGRSVFWALFGAIYLCFGMPEVYRVLFEVFGMDPEAEDCQPRLRRQLEDVDYVSVDKLSWQDVATYKPPKMLSLHIQGYSGLVFHQVCIGFGEISGIMTANRKFCRYWDIPWQLRIEFLKLLKPETLNSGLRYSFVLCIHQNTSLNILGFALSGWNMLAKRSRILLWLRGC